MTDLDDTARLALTTANHVHRKCEERLQARIAELEATIAAIRNKVHAHNRGGELYAGLREVIRDMCDHALAKWPHEVKP